MDDLFDTTPEEEMAARIAALRRQSQAGMLGQLTGDKVLAPFGASLVNNAQHGEQLVQQAQDRRLNRALLAQKEADLEEYRMRERHKFANQPGVGSYDFNSTTGEATPIAAAPPPRVALPRATGKGAAGKPVDVDKDLEGLKKDLDAWSGRAGQFGKEASLLSAADKIGRLIPIGPDGKRNFNLSANQIPELGAAVASMVMAGNQPAESLVEHFIPKTRGMNWAQKKAFFTNSPEEANVPEFVKQFFETSERESTGAKARMSETMRSRLAAHSGAYAKHQKEAANLARSYLSRVGLNPSDAELAQMFGAAAAGPSAASGPTATAGAAVGPHGPSITQKGNVYNWNPKTQQYE